ncbi:MAG: hypothetical protein Q8T13_16405 [Acidobacteriota bacterium]|nr:hypothetical protein [Acidobacteriota bacterium]
MSDRFVHLQRGFVVPVEAVEAALAIENAGHRLTLDGADLLIVPSGPVDPHDLEQLRRWKPHVLMILKYTADDRHLFDSRLSAPDCGPIVTTPRPA